MQVHVEPDVQVADEGFHGAWCHGRKRERNSWTQFGI